MLTAAAAERCAFILVVLVNCAARAVTSRAGMLDSCERTAGVLVVSGSGELGCEDVGMDEALSKPTAA